MNIEITVFHFSKDYNFTIKERRYYIGCIIAFRNSFNYFPPIGSHIRMGEGCKEMKIETMFFDKQLLIFYLEDVN